MKNQKCSQCIYFVKDPKSANQQGFCHRCPPQTTHILIPPGRNQLTGQYSGGGTMSQSSFPTVRADSVGCGEYLPSSSAVDESGESGDE